MKNTKIVALVAAVALLVLGTAFASFAASYNWYEQDGEWRCADKNGDDYYDAWAKSGDGWYWLNEEGWMARATLVDEEMKYVDETGRMVSNQWIKLTDDEGNEWWSYFQSGGKKMLGKETPTPVTVGGKKYIFDDAGKMLSGWVLPGYGDNSDDDAWKGGIYYCGDSEDGAVTIGWKLIECYDESQDFVDNNYWFYFQPNGKKFAAPAGTELKEKGVNGKTYVFDEYGVMKSDWQPYYDTTSAASASIGSYAWYQSAEIGAKFAKGWFRVIPQGDVDPANNEDEVSKWFYAKGGKLAESTIKTIEGKKYGFNAKGEMVSGLNYVTFAEIKEDEKVTGYTAAFTAIDDAVKLAYYVDNGTIGKYETCGIFFFSADEENDGSLKTGAQTINVDGDDYNFYFSTAAGSKGLGITQKQGNKYYYNGKKVAADDSKADYMFFERLDKEIYGDAVDVNKYEVPTPGIYYDSQYALIAKTGTVATSGTKKDGNGNTIKYYKVYEDADKKSYEKVWVVTAD